MMDEYHPHSWVIVKFASKADPTPVYKVLAGWAGGYTYGDSWQLNSGITKYTEEDGVYIFEGYSGSKYFCPKTAERLMMITANMLSYWDRQAEQKPELGLVIEQISFEQFEKEFKPDESVRGSDPG